MTFASCHNNITHLSLQSYVAQPILYTFNLPLSFFTSISIQDNTLKIMAASTLTSESTSISSQFQAPYVLSISYLGVSDSSFFERVNISKLLERFKNIYNDYQILTSKKIRRLLLYCEIFIVQHIRFVIKFSELDYIKICISLKKEYKDRNIAQYISSHIYLEVFKDKPRTKNTKVLQFYYDFSEISKELLGKKILDKYTQLRQFI